MNPYISATVCKFLGDLQKLPFGDSDDKLIMLLSGLTDWGSGDYPTHILAWQIPKWSGVEALCFACTQWFCSHAMVAFSLFEQNAVRRDRRGQQWHTHELAYYYCPKLTSIYILQWGVSANFTSLPFFAFYANANVRKIIEVRSSIFRYTLKLP